VTLEGYEILTVSAGMREPPPFVRAPSTQAA
jgi:hypothetical protein